MRDFYENLKLLSEAIGTSGDEGKVRKIIYDEVLTYPNCIAKTDNIGNLIVTKKGKNAPKNKVMLTAQMDEPGFIITHIDEKGFLKFSPIGEIDPRVLLDKRLVLGNSLVGLLGSKAIHLVKDDEFKKPASTRDLYIDIGADSEEEAKKLVSLGGRAVFDSEFKPFGEGCVMGKAVDSRVGCAVLLELLKNDFEYSFTACFTVKGELGGMGGSAAAFGVKPDIALVIGSVPTGDMPTSGGKTICKQGEGAVISFRDKATLYDMELYSLATELAKENDIKFQTKHGICGENEAKAIHTASGGIRTLSIAAPIRYPNSPYSVLKLSDAEEVKKLAEILVGRFCEL